MRLRTLAALVALFVCSGYVAASSCQFYDFCQHVHQEVGGNGNSTDQDNSTSSDSCQCLCHYLSFVSGNPSVVISATRSIIVAEFLLRNDRSVLGPVAPIDHPPQLG